MGPHYDAFQSTATALQHSEYISPNGVSTQRRDGCRFHCVPRRRGSVAQCYLSVQRYYIHRSNRKLIRESVHACVARFRSFSLAILLNLGLLREHVPCTPIWQRVHRKTSNFCVVMDGCLLDTSEIHSHRVAAIEENPFGPPPYCLLGVFILH